MKTSTPKPTRSKLGALRQLCNLIPLRLVSQLASEQEDAPKARTFSYWSQTVALIYAQLTHAIGLNDVCDSLRLHSGPLSAIRGATPPSRNNLSYANKERPAAIAEQLFWKTLEHLRALHPGFGGRHGGKRLAHRFKCAIQVVDSTTMELVANCMDWAKHRRRKAAAKCHLRLNLQSFLPSFAVIGTAKDNDNKRAREVCADIKEGEITLFDKAYVDFEHLCDLDERGVSWVTRAKDNMSYHVVKRHVRKPAGKILRDDEITLRVDKSRAAYGHKRLRRVVALVEVAGEEREMVFITNNFEWAAGTVADLYRCRWQIEVLLLRAAPRRSPLRGSLSAGCLAPLGSSRSNRRSSSRTSWATAPTLCAGRCGRRCWCMCCCALPRGHRRGAAAVCACGPSCARRYGRRWIW